MLNMWWLITVINTALGDPLSQSIFSERDSAQEIFLIFIALFRFIVPIVTIFTSVWMIRMDKSESNWTPMRPFIKNYYLAIIIINITMLLIYIVR